MGLGIKQDIYGLKPRTLSSVLNKSESSVSMLS
jgi:hypothetical protein